MILVKTDEQIVEMMHKEHCYEGMIELYHPLYGFVHTYAWYNQEDLYLLEDLEALLNDFSFIQFFSENKILEIMENIRNKWKVGD